MTTLLTAGAQPDALDSSGNTALILAAENGHASVVELLLKHGANELALPVADLDATSRWYSKHFGMVEVERIDQPVPTVIRERDGARIGFAVNGGDASQDGAAVLVSNIRGIKDEFEANGAKVANWRVDERDGHKYQVFFVVAPDGLCFYFHEPIE